MEFLSKNAASSAPSMNSTDPASSLYGFPNNSASMVNWLHLYHDHMAANDEGNDGTTGIIVVQQARHVPSSVAPTHDSEATSVTSKALPSPSNTPPPLSVNGATAKVGKKRSRASRRAPTTLLNTDTSNFRAMVQQFTGIPQSPLQSPFFARSLPHASLLPSASLPHYYNYRPQQFPPFPFQSTLQDNPNSAHLIPTCPSQGHPAGNGAVMDDAALASSSLFSNPSMAWSERKSGYLL